MYFFYRLFIQWIRFNNVLLSILGIIATITALLIMSDWQAALNDPCLEFSLYHNPHFGSTNTNHPVPSHQHCWSAKNWTSEEQNYHIIGVDRGHLVVMLTPNKDQQKGMLVCDVYDSRIGCNTCDSSKNLVLNTSLSLNKDGQGLCLETHYVTMDEHKNYTKELDIKCHGISNESCDIVCLHLFGSQGAILQDYDSSIIKDSYKSLMEDVYIQSLTLVDTNLYTTAMEHCEAQTKEHCHWIPNSVITKQHCGDCQPICRSVWHSLNFIQFSIGAFWFMFSMPVAEVSLPLIISDSVREEFQVCANI